MRAPGTAAARDDLVVVIVNHDTREHLLACLASLRAGGLDGLAASVTVVDNASTDGSTTAVQREHPDVGVVENRENIGYAAANNIALRQAGFSDVPVDISGQGHPRHALLLNPDTIVPPGALRALVAALDAEPDLGAVGPKLLKPDGTLDLACRRSFPTPEVSLYRFLGLSRLFPGSRRFGRYNLTYLDPDAPADVDSVVGACMLVRGRAIDQVGLLDETFWMYGEDLDWSLRMHRAGWRIGYRPQVVVWHEKRAASRHSERASYEFQRAMWIFYHKHYERSTPTAVHLLVLAALAARGGPRLVGEMRGAGPILRRPQRV